MITFTKNILFSIFFYFFFLGIGNVQASISGNLNIPEGWSPKLYLSVIYDYREIEVMNKNQIIATTKVDSTGYFEFPKEVLTDKSLIYRLHISMDENEIEMFYANHEKGGLGYNFVVFVADNKIPVFIEPSIKGKIFGKVQSENKNADSWQLLNLIYKNHIRKIYSNGAAAENHYYSSYHAKLITTTKNKNVISKLLACYYLIEEDANFTDEYLTVFSRNRSFYDKILDSLESHYPFYADRLQKEIASVDLLLNGDELENYKNRVKWLYVTLFGLLIIIGVLTGFLIRVTNKKTTPLLLSSQEEKIKGLILQGCANKEIAETLFISVSTVKTHINTLYKKEKVQSRKELMSKNSNQV